MTVAETSGVVVNAGRVAEVRVEAVTSTADAAEEAEAKEMC